MYINIKHLTTNASWASQVYIKSAFAELFINKLNLVAIYRVYLFLCINELWLWPVFMKIVLEWCVLCCIIPCSETSPSLRHSHKSSPQKMNSHIYSLCVYEVKSNNLNLCILVGKYIFYLYDPFMYTRDHIYIRILKWLIFGIQWR